MLISNEKICKYLYQNATKYSWSQLTGFNLPLVSTSIKQLIHVIYLPLSPDICIFIYILQSPYACFNPV